MSCEIKFSDLRVRPVGSSEGLDLSCLDLDANSDVHGCLEVRIAGQPLPCLGYWGPSDVCIPTWASVLKSLDHVLGASPEETFIFDEGEQGQPAFRFVRSKDHVYVSVVDSAVDGEAVPEWGVQPCLFADLRREIRQFLESLRQLLDAEAPEVASAWLRSQISDSLPSDEFGAEA